MRTRGKRIGNITSLGFSRCVASSAYTVATWPALFSIADSISTKLYAFCFLY